MMRFHTWWENKGCAPIYRRYDLALQLKSKDQCFGMKTDADVRTWLPGDTIYDDAVLVPREAHAGAYALSVGLIDQVDDATGRPACAGGAHSGGLVLTWTDRGHEVTPMADPIIFRPKPIDDVLYNPHIGFQTFQHFNGDDLFKDKRWTEIGPEEYEGRPASLENKDHPYTTVAYLRWYWDQMEPRDGEYRWDIIDGALKTARERGQTLAIRVMCHDHAGEHDVPEWFKKTGAKGGSVDVQRGGKLKYWVPDYSDPLYIKYWTRINRELAAAV